jgi:hypothetical protein
MKHILKIFPLIIWPLLAVPTWAEVPKVEGATAQSRGGSWTFAVTLSHPDTGWDHYADGWEVLSLDGTRLGFRELVHPHVEEQPFTRSLSGVAIPAGTTKVLIRARCNVDGWSEETFEVELTN